VTIPDQKLVTGTVVDCDELPVDAGYVLVNGAAHFCTAGVFEVYTCAASITLRGVDVLNANVSSYSTVELITDTTNVGELIACTPLFGTVTDIDGNTYQTVIIGNQEWMAENLRTGTYSDGTTIPNVTEDTVWTELNSGAWSNYDHSPGNDATYGKLYNGYAAADPRNVCPLGWHVPTDAEWQQLESALGMPTDQLGQSGVVRGSAQNVGGKLKATILWAAPNTGATNESGFSALPGGSRNGGTGNFQFLVSNGYWWTATAYGAEYSWYRYLGGSANAGIHRFSQPKLQGFSVRCVRD
jgi:uncharacterized protein (TIGR02145 family)